MLIRRPSDILSSEITPKRFYGRRREFMKLAAAGSILGAAGAIMILMGLAMMTGRLTTFGFWLLQTFPALGRIG